MTSIIQRAELQAEIWEIVMERGQTKNNKRIR